MSYPIPAILAGAYLHHVAMESPDPDALAAFYSRVMQMAASPSGDGEWRCEGPARRFVAVKGTSRKMAYAGLACRDADAVRGLKAYVEKSAIEILTCPSPYFTDEAFAVRDPDGNLICFGVADPQPVQSGLRAPTQHLTFASLDVEAFKDFYHDKLGFALSDLVVRDDGSLATCFTRSNHEHHTIACFKANRTGVDHHSYEAGEWDTIRDWCDHFAANDVPIMWGPGRHGPGNNLFVFIEDPDGNWIEVSAELEVVHDRQVQSWPHEARTLNKWGKAILRS